MRFLMSVVSLSGARIFTVLSQVVVLPIVARYLDAADFGDAALAMTLVLFAQLLSDAGISRSLIRQRVWDPAEWSTVFWLLVGLGVALASLTAAIAPLWAWLYGRPTLGPVVTAMASVPFFFACSAVPTAWMEREDRFTTIALIRFLGACASLATVVALAVSGAGVWALAAQQIVLAAVLCLLSFALSGFRPGKPWVWAPVRHHLVFGRDTIGVSLVFTLQRQVPVMIVGYAAGATSLGYYSMAQRVWNVARAGVASPISQAVFPRLSAARETPDRVGKIYLGSMLLIAVVILPGMAVVASVAEDVFALLLSETWRVAGKVFALAALGIALEAVTAPAGVLFQALNRTGLRLQMVTERAAVRLLCVAVAAPFGVIAVAGAISLSSALYAPRVLFLVARASGSSAGTTVCALAVPAAMSVFGFMATRAATADTTGWGTVAWAGLIACLAIASSAAASLPRLRGTLARIAESRFDD